MDKKYYIELLERFFRGLTSEEENDILKDWIRQSGSRDDIYKYYQQSWHIASDEMDETIQKEIYSNIIKEIDNIPDEQEISTEKKVRISILRYIAAASIILIVALSAYFIGHKQADAPKGMITMSVMNGQKGNISLVDGTQVYLNSGSKIIYDNSYNEKERKLILEGEAYFEVAKDKDKRFIVEANGINVEALGTSFNVKAHKNDKSVSVILIEGSIKVGDDSQEDILIPNERIEYDLQSRKFAKSELHANINHLLWRSEELAFYGESLEDVCKILTRMYNCQFVFKSEDVKKYTYNGVIKNNSLGNVLDFISQTASIRYEINDNNTIVIYQKK